MLPFESDFLTFTCGDEDERPDHWTPPKPKR